MEIIYISAEDLSTHESHLNNIISINSNHYWDVDDSDVPCEYSELIYA